MSVGSDPLSDDAQALAWLLRWYADMGVDAAVDPIAHDRFAESAPAPKAGGPPIRAPFVPPSPKPAATASLPIDVPAGAAEGLPPARTLDELRAQLLAFEGCALKATATQLVFADGNPQADIMFVGEAPGADEDRQGLPFVGRAGQLLDKMLAAIDLDRRHVYIANVVPWRPPGNRTPTPLETSACLPFMRRQIELVSPKILVCLGAAATQTLIGVKEGIMRIRGRWYDYDMAGARIPAIAMLHPAYLLRQPSHKKFAWQDLRELAKKMRAM